MDIVHHAVCAKDASRTGYAEAKRHAHLLALVAVSMQAAQATLRQRAYPYTPSTAPGMQAAQATLRQRATIKLPPSNVMDASRTGYCARQKQTSAARQEIFECVEKQNQWH